MGMTEADRHRPELVSAMLEPGFYPHAPRSVELRETHISWVFLTDHLAYKVKKPVVFPFLDYGSAERRNEMCREEVRLNRRLAPEIYLGVVGVSHSGDRWSLTSEDDPAAIEYAVEMRRVEERRSLASLVARGELAPEQVAAVAGRLARFHAEAPVAPSDRQVVDVLVETLDENLATLRQACREVADERRLDAAQRFTDSFVAARREELEARARAGLVRDCHGDLRAEHVIVPSKGDVYIYDCVEFNPALRQIDVAADFAFLIMDLTALGAGGLASRLIADYRRAGGDPGDDALVSFFASYRAWVRAKVGCLGALELPAGDPERQRRRAEVGDLLRLGHRFAWRARQPLVLVICGVAGTGKTTLARMLASINEWPHVSSDVTRKRLAGLASTERGGTEHYSIEFTMRTYEEMGRIARRALDRSGGVIVDATFHRRDERAAFRAGLGERSVRLVFVECRAPPDVLLARVRERALERDPISDADAEVVERQLAEFEPLDEAPEEARTELVTQGPPEELANEVEEFVDRSIWGAR